MVIENPPVIGVINKCKIARYLSYYSRDPVQLSKSPTSIHSNSMVSVTTGHKRSPHEGQPSK